MELVTLDITSLPWPLKSSTDFCRTSRTLPKLRDGRPADVRL